MRKLLCRLLGHDYRIMETTTTLEISQCTRCGASRWLFTRPFNYRQPGAPSS